MSIDKFYTIGVYGYSEALFFEKLIQNGIDLFIDIRRRRAVRGNKYSFVNSTKLQKKLSDLNINYIHVLNLAPTKEIRAVQKISDLENGVKKSEREELSHSFIYEYKSKVLDKFNMLEFMQSLQAMNIKKPLFFCVEKNPKACHRSIVVDKLYSEFNTLIQNL